MIGQVGLGLLIVALCAAIQCAWAQPIKRPTTWQPDPPKYGYNEKKDIPVRMDDGVVLRADEYFPVNPVTGAKAPDRFPVLLAETPYGKGRAVQNLADYFRTHINTYVLVRSAGKWTLKAVERGTMG